MCCVLHWNGPDLSNLLCFLFFFGEPGRDGTGGIFAPTISFTQVATSSDEEALFPGIVRKGLSLHGVGDRKVKMAKRMGSYRDSNAGPLANCCKLRVLPKRESYH